MYRRTGVFLFFVLITSSTSAWAGLEFNDYSSPSFNSAEDLQEYPEHYPEYSDEYSYRPIDRKPAVLGPATDQPIDFAVCAVTPPEKAAASNSDLAEPEALDCSDL